MINPMKSLTSALSFRSSARNADNSSASVYSFASNEWTGPFPSPSHKARTRKVCADRNKFIAEMEQVCSFVHLDTTCLATFISFPNLAGVYPAAIKAAENLCPNVDKLASPFNSGDIKIMKQRQYMELLSSTPLFISPVRLFAASSPVEQFPRHSFAHKRAGGSLFRSHVERLRFFVSDARGNSTGNGGYSHE